MLWGDGLGVRATDGPRWVEVFIIGVLVSLVKIGAMATIVIGISFWAYIGFVLCFIAAIGSLDRFQIWREIEACQA